MASSKVAQNGARNSVAEPIEKDYGGLAPQQLIEIYRLMYSLRRVDDREILLKRQQKIFFQISGAGHEALQVGAAAGLRPGYDWFFPYYRDRALCLALASNRLRHAAAGRGRGHRPGQRRPPDAHPLEQPRSTSSALRLPPARNCSTPWAAPRPAATSAAIPKPRKARRRLSRLSRREVHGDEVVYVSSARVPPRRASSGRQ
jgi:2-oxoisovalerate dehydrogenase E1 component